MIHSLRRRQGVVSCSWVIVVFLMQLVFLHSTMLAEDARASAFLDLAPLSAAPSGPVMYDSRDNHENEDDLVGADKREVPTGANPLHNR
ncbi:uncharacterized protein LOC108511172 [Phoenix dactylifera]|uniref:Uncharacterized protein LOC108511172 n=1 Tax=Phoenix dactylifera TaxID=42345 RepID=A0A8B8J2B8_PHODC|nr:uncharacterized protein LOC108511172 [Phoenix dactylifera]